tara:strand:+ start:1 stop:924 length:924 start_codon:yes stop_codon:yes gene_type:complete
MEENNSPIDDLHKLSTPKFGGSQNLAKQNFLSHKWFRPNENEPEYCAVCDVRDYHKGKFYPCCYIQPKNGFSGFTEKDFDNLEWDETSRQQMNGVTYNVFPQEEFVFAEYSEEDASKIVSTWSVAPSSEQDVSLISEKVLPSFDSKNNQVISNDPIQESLDFEVRELKLVPFRGSLDKAVENFLSHMWVGDDEYDLDAHCLVCGTNITTLRRLYPCCFEETEGYEYFSSKSFDKISSNKEKLEKLKEKIDRENINLLHQTKQEVFESLSSLYTDSGQYKNLKAIKKIGRNELCPCGSKDKYKKCHGI